MQVTIGIDWSEKKQDVVFMNEQGVNTPGMDFRSWIRHAIRWASGSMKCWWDWRRRIIC
jgi:hypothetical protein